MVYYTNTHSFRACDWSLDAVGFIGSHGFCWNWSPIWSLQLMLKARVLDMRSASDQSWSIDDYFLQLKSSISSIYDMRGVTGDIRYEMYVIKGRFEGKLLKKLITLMANLCFVSLLIFVVTLTMAPLHCSII